MLNRMFLNRIGRSKTVLGRSKTVLGRSKTGKDVLKQKRTFLNRIGRSNLQSMWKGFISFLFLPNSTMIKLFCSFFGRI